MGDTFEKRKREQQKRLKKQEKALRKQERAHEREELEARGESPADRTATLEDIVGAAAHPTRREMSDAARSPADPPSERPMSAAARRAAEAGRALRGGD